MFEMIRMGGRTSSREIFCLMMFFYLLTLLVGSCLFSFCSVVLALLLSAELGCVSPNEFVMIFFLRYNDRKIRLLLKPQPNNPQKVSAIGQHQFGGFSLPEIII